MKIKIVFGIIGLCIFLELLTSCRNNRVNACFMVRESIGGITNQLEFDASCSQNATYFQWNFGDGTIITNTTSKLISHTYLSKGEYNVILEVKGKDGVSLLKNNHIIEKTVIIR